MQDNIQMKTTPRALSEGRKDEHPSVEVGSDALQAKMQNTGNPFKSSLPGSVVAPPFQFKSEMPVQRQSEEEESLSA